MKEKKSHYINNKEFLQKFLDWHETEEYKNTEKPRPPEDIILDCWTIVQHYVNQRKWYNVPQEILEEAIPLAIEFCIRYLHNFNPEKTKNPFSYVTSLTTNAILQCYNKDKQEKENRMKLLTSTMSSATYIRSDGEIDCVTQGEFSQNYIKHLEALRKDYENDK